MPEPLHDPSPNDTPLTPRTRAHRSGALGDAARRFRRLPPARRRLVAGVSAGAAVLLIAGVVAPIVVSGSDASASAPTAQSMSAAAEVTPTSTVNATAVTAISSATGSVAGGTTLTVSGVDVDGVTRVVFGDQDAQILSATSTEVTVAVPAATSFSPTDVGVAVYADDLRVDGDALSYSYDIVSPVDAQMAYVFQHWDDYNLAEYGSLDDTDCANFASQSLLQRGWTQTSDWWAEGTGDDFDFSKAWVSSTYFMNYAADHPELATALDDAQRDQVKVGDIVQFDWDNSGDRDHTGIVSKVEQTDAGVVISYAGHTDDTDYRTVDEAITVIHPGASVYYWSIA
ncbi:MAG TPA: amidase domain-containing protein [Plantibacter sp.]|uniref:amidase domain-containing protein n=1 Tax=unclassified Plantibacter TaxID=2624265 RepID=UPI002CAC8130|nr:amidase domain-containing protein [Plantibacter sp.]